MLEYIINKQTLTNFLTFRFGSKQFQKRTQYKKSRKNILQLAGVTLFLFLLFYIYKMHKQRTYVYL